MRTIWLLRFLFWSMALPAPAQTDAQIRALERSQRQAEDAQQQVQTLRRQTNCKLQEYNRYRRQAEYYQQKAGGYRREASYYLEKYKKHQRQAAYYTRRGDTRNARVQEREAHNALTQSRMYLQKMTDASNQAINCLTKARQALE